MIWFRPARRGVYRHWFTSPKLMNSEMSRFAAVAIYRCFNLFPWSEPAANDDGLRW
jgi:hypothetical protein